MKLVCYLTILIVGAMAVLGCENSQKPLVDTDKIAGDDDIALPDTADSDSEDTDAMSDIDISDPDISSDCDDMIPDEILTDDDAPVSDEIIIDEDAAVSDETPDIDTDVECVKNEDCDNGQFCTVDTCSEQGICVHSVITDYCFVDGGCYHDGILPENECMECDASSDPYQLVPVPGTPSCTTDDKCVINKQCVAGQCVGTPKCDDGLSCTINTCNPGDGICSYPLQEGFCLVDIQDYPWVACYSTADPSICAIGGACYAAEAVNNTNACEVCKPEISRDTWDKKPDYATCDFNGTGMCFAEKCLTSRWKNASGTALYNVDGSGVSIDYFDGMWMGSGHYRLTNLTPELFYTALYGASGNSFSIMAESEIKDQPEFLSYGKVEKGISYVSGYDLQIAVLTGDVWSLANELGNKFFSGWLVKDYPQTIEALDVVIDAPGAKSYIKDIYFAGRTQDRIYTRHCQYTNKVKPAVWNCDAPMFIEPDAGDTYRIIGIGTYYDKINLEFPASLYIEKKDAGGALTALVFSRIEKSTGWVWMLSKSLMLTAEWTGVETEASGTVWGMTKDCTGFRLSRSNTDTFSVDAGAYGSCQAIASDSIFIGVTGIDKYTTTGQYGIPTVCVTKNLYLLGRDSLFTGSPLQGRVRIGNSCDMYSLKDVSLSALHFEDTAIGLAGAGEIPTLPDTVRPLFWFIER